MGRTDNPLGSATDRKTPSRTDVDLRVIDGAATGKKADSQVEQRRTLKP